MISPDHDIPGPNNPTTNDTTTKRKPSIQLVEAAGKM